MLLCELLGKGQGAGAAGAEALQRSRDAGGHLQPLPGRTSAGHRTAFSLPDAPAAAASALGVLHSAWFPRFLLKLCAKL